MARVRFVCRYCKGDNVMWDANSEWCEATQQELLRSSHDDAYCGDCDRDTEALEEKHPE